MAGGGGDASFTSALVCRVWDTQICVVWKRHLSIIGPQGGLVQHQLQGQEPYLFSSSVQSLVFLRPVWPPCFLFIIHP